jgi:hypothetical protein
MQNNPMPQPPGAPVGKLTRVSVTYTIDTPEGPAHAIVGLNPMRKIARPERLAELLDDLALLCEDVITAKAVTAPAAFERILQSQLLGHPDSPRRTACGVLLDPP